MAARTFAIPFVLLVIGACIFACVGYVETPLVSLLWQTPWPAFRDFMSNSFYEGQSFGASDIGVTAAIICFFVWVWHRKEPGRVKMLSHQELKFIWLSSFLTAIVAVHSLKWIIGRARPRVFFEMFGLQAENLDALAAIHLPGFLPIIGPRGLNLNSFPSGHTASCAILLTFCYVLWPKNKAVSLVAAILVLFMACAMATARSMAGMHWLSDSVASIFLTWSIIHINWLRLNKKSSL